MDGWIDGWFYGFTSQLTLNLAESRLVIDVCVRVSVGSPSALMLSKVLRGTLRLCLFSSSPRAAACSRRLVSLLTGTTVNWETKKQDIVTKCAAESQRP